jgi:hypothetical protein
VGATLGAAAEAILSSSFVLPSRFGLIIELGAVLAVATCGAALAQSLVLRPFLRDTRPWFWATLFGGLLGIIVSAGLLFGGDWLVDRLTGASGFVTWAGWLVLSPLGALPLALAQRRALSAFPHARSWVLVVLAGAVLAGPAAITSAGVALETIHPWVDVLARRFVWAIGLEFDLAIAVGAMFGWATMALSTGIRLQGLLERNSGAMHPASIASA